MSDLFRVSRELDWGGRPHPLLQCLLVPPPVQERLRQVSVFVRIVLGKFVNRTILSNVVIERGIVLRGQAQQIVGIPESLLLYF